MNDEDDRQTVQQAAVFARVALMLSIIALVVAIFGLFLPLSA